MLLHCLVPSQTHKISDQTVPNEHRSELAQFALEEINTKPAVESVLVTPGGTFTTLDGIQIITPPKWYRWDGKPITLTLKRLDPTTLPARYPLAQGESYVSSFYSIEASGYLQTQDGTPFVFRIPVHSTAGKRVKQNEMFCIDDAEGLPEGLPEPREERCGWMPIKWGDGGTPFMDLTIKGVPRHDRPGFLVFTEYLPSPLKSP